jgi:hypothetical protein
MKRDFGVACGGRAEGGIVLNVASVVGFQRVAWCATPWGWCVDWVGCLDARQLRRSGGLPLMGINHQN